MAKPMDLTRFDFYALRFRESETVQQMTAEEVGQYLLLMVEAWLHGKNASLPNNPKLLAIYARVPKVSDLVLSCWTERDGRLYNERLSDEWDATVVRHDFAHERAKKGAEARYGKKDAPSIPEAFPDNAPIHTIPIHTIPSIPSTEAASPINNLLSIHKDEQCKVHGTRWQQGCYSCEEIADKGIVD